MYTCQFSGPISLSLSLSLSLLTFITSDSGFSANRCKTKRGRQRGGGSGVASLFQGPRVLLQCLASTCVAASMPACQENRNTGDTQLGASDEYHDRYKKEFRTIFNDTKK